MPCLQSSHKRNHVYKSGEQYIKRGIRCNTVFPLLLRDICSGRKGKKKNKGHLKRLQGTFLKHKV